MNPYDKLCKLLSFGGINVIFCGFLTVINSEFVMPYGLLLFMALATNIMLIILYSMMNNNLNSDLMQKQLLDKQHQTVLQLNRLQVGAEV